ncbi:sarcosine oxidase subunit delta [Rhizobium leguminosarum]|uniref:sarcosine oxidase subunit delta n=1 Tax=Rhizobium leguminosarum TaxID=384 RepID=UPI001C97B175|nr:sarcosine oxidase subunit delta [Rhizobium leguminosarum]MBY5568320.1 sarcosine oxidase subunit delta [Rhizobium leguminosarum]MBY5575455.1 sarcosine oxidase subunit delta [Rhizobium leguminosarum]
MASLISCPHCGARPKEEFSIRGDAGLIRPAPDASAEAWFDYVYLRDNPRGRHSEYWHHSSGCRRWLIVERDTVTHAVLGVRDAALSKLGGEPA